jgi:hypothetical protein
MYKLGREFVRHVVPQIIKPIRTLWNEMVGFVFLCLALIPAPRAIRQWHDYSTTGKGLSRLLVYFVFIGLMAIFAVQSFLRARKISRS